jgi:DNA-binding protein HU-beta
MATKPAVAKKAAAKAAPKAPAKTAASTPVPNKAAPAKAPAAPAKKSAPAPTIAMKAVFEQLADSHDLSKRQAQSLLTDMVEAVTTHLKNGDRIRINGLGILEVRNHEARMGRNPATGESIQIAASKKVAFRPAKELKDAV